MNNSEDGLVSEYGKTVAWQAVRASLVVLGMPVWPTYLMLLNDRVKGTKVMADGGFFSAAAPLLLARATPDASPTAPPSAIWMVTWGEGEGRGGARYETGHRVC